MNTPTDCYCEHPTTPNITHHKDKPCQGPLRTISYGGGVQSTALIVLATQGKLNEVMGGPIDAALFANVGDDSEHPDTLAYIRTIIQPWATTNADFPIHELQKTFKRGNRAGTTETIMQRLTKPGSRSIPIPIRGLNGAPGSRACTVDFKVKVLGQWAKQHGATKTNPAHIAIGISTDEYQRANTSNAPAYEIIHYPLLDLNISRADCANIIRDAGLPVPPKSSCYFCPFHSKPHWSEMRRDRPDLFQQAIDLENHINNRPDRKDKLPLYLTRYGVPLTEAIPEAQDALFGTDDWTMDNDGECDTGYCFT